MKQKLNNVEILGLKMARDVIFAVKVGLLVENAEYSHDYKVISESLNLLNEFLESNLKNDK